MGSTGAAPLSKRARRDDRKSEYFKTKGDKLSRVRLKSGTRWTPPRSPFNLFQESLYHDPWKLLVGTIFLNRTTGEEALGKNILWKFLDKWPTPEETIKASWEELAAVIQPLGLHEKRAKMIIRFSGDAVNLSLNSAVISECFLMCLTTQGGWAVTAYSLSSKRQLSSVTQNYMHLVIHSPFTQKFKIRYGNSFTCLGASIWRGNLLNANCPSPSIINSKVS
ncbi:Methyl-CpG-binding domain protein 4 [Portunus trituberculatus]|uniref:Methyl-CpG-binding domain protein 4 n=1 Tax=Portunus trituberculatus TaxID=210409 RepID=A0A5B7D8N2_PORTR|nr:Methyl-CpG-binding domain protein 4 [Portunus trituberculatus]